MRQLVLATLGAMLMVSGFGEAFANPLRIPNASGERTTFRMDGLTPGTEIQVGLSDVKARAKAHTINNYARLSPPANATQVRLMNQTWINLSSATDLTASVRVSTVQGQRQFAPRVTGDALPALPSLFKLGTTFYFNPGFTIPEEGIYIQYDVPVRRVARVNACGQLSVSVNSINGHVDMVPSITVNGTDYTIASLPIGTPANLSRCLKFGESTYVRYVPQ